MYKVKTLIVVLDNMRSMSLDFEYMSLHASIVCQDSDRRDWFTSRASRSANKPR